MDTKKVLVVDDEDMVKDVVIFMLKKIFARDNYDYEIISASNGEEALEKTRESHPSLVISDLNMPKIDGLALHSILEEDFPDVAFVLMTGAKFSEDDLRIYGLDSNHFLKKIFKFPEFDAIVSNILCNR